MAKLFLIMQSGRERLAEWIARSKCNQTQAAEILGITSAYLSQILNGVRTPGLANAVKIERITGVAVDSWVLNDISDDSETPVDAVTDQSR